jgi:hypothetical protein
MPRLTRSVPDEMLLGAGVHMLDPDLPLIAAQAGMLLGRSKTRMDDDRRDSKPPKAYKDGRKILYRLGDVLSQRAIDQGKTLTQVAKERAEHRLVFPTFAGFMASASQEETWPVATVDGVPMDFFQTIGLVMVDEQFGMIEDLMLVEFLERRLAAGKN